MFSISFAAIAILSEIIVRIVAPQPIIPRFVESAPYGIRKVLANVEAQHVTQEYRYKYTSNSMGFRGRDEYELTADKGLFRIVVQGDSVTLGHGVADHETYAYLLEQNLRRAGRKVEVLNMGVSGFGTAEEIIQYENVAINYSPDLVILGYFQNDDLNNHVSQLYGLSGGQLNRKSLSFQPGLYLRDRLYKMPFYSFLSQNSHIFTFMRTQASVFVLRNLAEKNFVSVEQKISDKATEQASELTRRLLQEYARMVTSSGSDLIIVDIADIQLKTDFPDDIKLGTGVMTIATKPIFAQSLGNGEELFYKVDAHPTAAGHQLIARILYDYILAKGLPPAAGSSENSDDPNPEVFNSSLAEAAD